VLSVVLNGVWFSFRLVLAGFGMGLVAGVLLAVLMTRFRVAERAILPYLVISQTVPLIALAPLVATWGGKVEIAGWEWPRWLTAPVCSVRSSRSSPSRSARCAACSRPRRQRWN
jgi:ABC-type amino acid transport system permease subunit